MTAVEVAARGAGVADIMPGGSLAGRSFSSLRVAIVHYWLVAPGGGEKVVQAIQSLFPQADIFTLVEDRDYSRSLLGDARVTASFLQKVPFATRIYRSLLPLMPAALENLDLTGYDLVISSEAGPAKGVLPPLGAVHVCYCHSPMRYIWDHFHAYRRDKGPIGRLLMSAFVARLRAWDFTTAARVDHFLSNSRHVQRRVEQYYRRSSEVVHPPVDTHEFAIGAERGDYYLLTGRHVGYKRIDLAIAACRKLGRRLIVTGTGPETERLKRLGGRDVEFVGRCSFADLKRYYAGCRAFLMPGEEDFGIAPVEAMASGRPVIAYADGGALDTVVPGLSGVLFGAQTADALADAILRFEAQEADIDPVAIRAHAETFNHARFIDRFSNAVRRALDDGPAPATDARV